MRRIIYSIVIASLLVSLLPPARLSAASKGLTTQPSNYPTTELPNYLTPLDTQPLLRAIPAPPTPLYDIDAELQAPEGPYRTNVTIRGAADLARLKTMGVTILSSTKTNAVVIADRSQLEQMAKLQFAPRGTELTDRLQAQGGSRLPRTATSAQILAATAVDADSDGLNDTEEGWWCTNPNLADSDNDKVNDGDEVNALRDWIRHTRATRPASGKPFAGWPPNQTGCYDSDYDSVPDAVEVYVFGLNPNRESTARDKFDDGQKLFGLTNCPGSGGGCGYGALPRQADWGVIFAEMPSWVKAPYDSPFVAAFPDPDVEVVPSSFVVTAKTTITTDHTISNGEAKTYGTSQTRGTSSSVANTQTWNSWQEVSVSTPQRTANFQLNPEFHRQPETIRGYVKPPPVPGGGSYNAIGYLGTYCMISELVAGALQNPNLTCYGQVGTLASLPGTIMQLAQDLRRPVTLPLNENTGEGPDNFNLDISIPQAYPNACFPKSSTQQAPKLESQATTGSSVVSCRGAGQLSYDSHQSVANQSTTVGLQELNRGNANQIVSTDNNSSISVQKVINASYPLAQVPVTTVSNGRSWGGALTTTQTEYEEHTISQSQQFSSSQSWGTATAVNTTQAAELRFTYRISNKGTDYAREISGIAFDIYIGDDPNPVATYYPAADIGSGGKFTNFMPGETHTYSTNSTGTNPIYLTLDQMRQIDTGAHIYIVVEDFSYGVDELFYQDAINSGASFPIDSGDGILHTYVLPTWGTETIQDVAKRFFPVTEDADGDLLSLSVPHYDAATPIWTVHALTGTSWWNLYLNNLGDGSAAFKDTPASANSTVLIRMNSDTDRDGYSDRTELALGTIPDDPASHPTPQLTAVTRSTRVGNTVTVNMAFLNSGNYDAYGVEAVLYAPDATTTINDNTIGGSGRVKSASQIVLGSRIMPASTTNWRGTSKPYATGSYSGNTDKVFTFTAANPGNISQGTVNLNWNDGAGNSGTVNYGSGYNAPLPVTIRDGLQIGFDTGTVNTGDVFTVEVRLPRDTFSYTVNGDPYTKPVVVVSYNDPQGNHKFVTPVEVNDLGTNLVPYSSQMLPGVGVDISTNAAFNASSNNTVYLIANSPHSQSIVNGHLFVEYVNDAGTVVAEDVFTQTLQSGPTVVPVTFSVSRFTPAYQPGHDYTLLAFFTDSQGNIIDSHARLFSTFGTDPQPVLNTSPASWNFGTVAPGAQPQQVISVVNTGIMPLNVVVNSSDPKLMLSGASGILSIPPAGTRPVTATLDTTALSGAVSMAITIRSNDPAHQTVTVPVNGTVTTASASAAAFDIANRPLDKTVRVYGNVAQFTPVDFTHGIQPDTVSIEPCKVLDATGTTLKGVGKYCADFASGTASYQMFGDGVDGSLTVTANPTIVNLYAGLSTTANVGQTTLNLASNPGFLSNHEVLIHQTQGVGAGTWETNTVTSVVGTTLSLQRPLISTYTQGGNSRAQIIRVPHYTDVTVQSGGVLTAPAWDGSSGGILVFRVKGTLTVNGSIDVTGKGFRGGSGGTKSNDQVNGWNGESYPGTSWQTPGGDGKTPPNASGGGGGVGRQGGGGGGGGGGAGFSTPGRKYIPNQGSAAADPGGTYGEPTLISLYLGAGGGGGGAAPGNPGAQGGTGGRGGGAVLLLGNIINVSGGIFANGQRGGNAYHIPTYEEGGGGGGSGGSIKVIGSKVSLGGNNSAAGGDAGQGSKNGDGYEQWGGYGGDGRIRVEYCDTLSGSTSPAANTQKLICYIADSITNISFGTGADGPLTITTSQTINNTRTALSTTSNTGQPTLNVASTSGFAANQEVLIHQTQGTGAGTYEFGKIASIGSGTLTLQQNLQNTFTQGGNSRAQVIRVPHYTDVTVPSGGTLTAPVWDGNTGGILVFRANGTLNASGMISANGANGNTCTGAGCQIDGSSGGGFRGGRGINTGGSPAYQGEGTAGTGTTSKTANSNGGGGAGSPVSNGSPGGGGGHANSGQNGQQSDPGNGGSTAGSPDLSNMVFGGGGGGGTEDSGSTKIVGAGGNGGGIVFIAAKTITISGAVLSNGGNGGNSNQDGGGGGGAGGSVLLRGQSVSLGNNLVASLAGAGGIGGGRQAGGNGSVGRIRVEYCETLSGTTNPAASTQKLNCYIADKPDASTIHFTVPDNVTNGMNYVMQFSRHLAFTGAGNQLTYTRVVSQTYASATMDALVTNVGAGGTTNLQVQVGSQTVYSQALNITQPTTISIPNFASAVNQYIVSQPPGSSVDVPMRVTIDRQADVMLTNVGLTPGAGLDLSVTASDLVIGCPGGAACLATEGNTIPISVTVRNTGAQNASSAVVGYYVGDPQNGGRLLGNSYVATIPAGGTATANFTWDTSTFTHTQTLYALVDPPNAIAETLESNNIVSQTLYIKTKPELRVASIALDRTDRVVGESILATVVISNTGETDAVAHNTRVSIQGERGDLSSGDVATASVVASNAVTITASFIPGKFGTHTITMTTDIGNVVGESNEANNVLTRTVYVGLPAQSIDAGSASDTSYNANSGFGYLNGVTYDFGTPSGSITKTVRYDSEGNLQYRFDGLQPSRFYHLDATFYQEGESFTQKVLFDEFDSGQTVPLADGAISTASLFVPSSAYTDTTMVVSVQRPSGGPLAPTRFRKAGSTVGPSFVSQLSLLPIEYTYLDSGGASDVEYDANRGYGYLGNNTRAGSLGGTEAISTYRSAFGDTLYYQFDRLDPAKNYLLDFTMYDGASSTRIQSVTLDNNPVASCTNLAANSTQRIQCPIDPARYTSDRIVIVGIVCVGCTGPRVNEIALEEKNRDVLSPALPPPSPTPTPGAAQTTVSSFAAQWSGSLVQVTWATTAESKLSKFELYRTTTLDPAAWTLVRTQTSQSNCATSSTPFSYAYADNTVVNTQTYYYKLTWNGDTCGGTGGAHAAMAIASPIALASLTQAAGWNLVSLPVSPTLGYNANSVATAINAQGGNCTEVDRWRDGWESHVLGLPFNNFTLDLNSGFFLKCTRPGSWSLQGLSVSQPRALNLFAGWNLISIPYAPIALSAETMTDQMNAQGGNCPEVDRWLDGWDSHLNGLPFNDFAIEKGVGYFVKCTKSSTYIPNNVGQPLTPARASISKPVVNPARRPTVSSVKITNVRDTMFTVSWVTSIASQGWVNFGPSPTLGTTAYDDRGPATVSTTHHVTVHLLNPSTLYYFDVVSDGTVDNNGGSHYSVSTGPTLGLPSSDAVYGRVFQSGGVTPAVGALVYVTLNDNNGQGTTGSSQPLSAITDGDGYWALNLGNTRVSALNGYYLYSASGDRLSVTADGGQMGTGSRMVDTGADAPAASLSLALPLQNHLYFFPFIRRSP